MLHKCKDGSMSVFRDKLVESARPWSYDEDRESLHYIVVADSTGLASINLTPKVLW